MFILWLSALAGGFLKIMNESLFRSRARGRALPPVFPTVSPGEFNQNLRPGQEFRYIQRGALGFALSARSVRQQLPGL